MEHLKHWKMQGNLYLWKHKGRDKTFEGAWHINFDKAGCQSLLQLLDSIQPQKDIALPAIPVAQPSTKTLMSKYPTALEEVSVPSRLKVVIDEKTPWSLTSQDSGQGFVLELRMNTVFLKEFRAAVQGALQEKADYSLPFDDAYEGPQRLWFWWLTDGRQGRKA